MATGTSVWPARELPLNTAWHSGPGNWLPHQGGVVAQHEAR